MQTDWGGEYQKLNSFFQRIGVTHYVSCPHAHQQNGSTERKHQHIVEVGLSLLAHVSMPLKYWDQTFLTTTFLINRVPSKVIDNATPLELVFNQSPDYKFLRTFGCACWPNLRPYNTKSFNFAQRGVCSQAIALCINVLNVWMFLKVAFISHGMSFSMNVSSPLLTCILMREHNSVLKSCSFQKHLRIHLI
jgi:hypothetical protein